MKSYRLLIHLFLPFIFIYTAKIAFRYRSLRYFLQRLGFLYPAVNKNRVWIHCASVGEVNTAMPLIKLLLENHPDQEILITTVTPTGAEIVARNKLAGLVHCYLPVDLYFCVNRFMKKIKPGLALILETELWPELYYQCNRQNAAITIINARLSKRTLQANNWMKNQYQSALSLVDRVLARSEDDKKGFIQLGCTVEKIEVLGNLKFAHESNLAPVEIDNFTLRPFVLLASSHNDEEMQFARMWQSIDSRNRLLVIAPRHPERGPGIANELQGLGLNIALRSRQDVITDDTEVYVADTLGELTGFMAMAELVFMGGSLIEHGGQNILEPARLGKPVIIGPHFYNFQQEVDLFLEHGACVQVADIEQLAETIGYLLDNDQAKNQLSSKISQLMQQQTSVVENYRDRLVAYYKNYF